MLVQDDIKGKGKRSRKVVSREQYVTRSVLPIGKQAMILSVPGLPR